MPKKNRRWISFKHQDGVDTKLDLDLQRQPMTPDRFNVLRKTEEGPQLARCLCTLNSRETWQSRIDPEVRQRKSLPDDGNQGNGPPVIVIRGSREGGLSVVDAMAERQRGGPTAQNTRKESAALNDIRCQTDLHSFQHTPSPAQ